MRIKYDELKSKMPEITGLMFTRPDLQDKRATEIWIKFRNDGIYAYINFEQPLKNHVTIEKLVGAGNALNCSDYKKDNELIQYAEKSVVIDILEKSKNFRGNIEETVEKILGLFSEFKNPHLYY